MAQIGLLEDNTRIAKLCATMLQYAGHQVTIYEHPRDCLDALLLPSVMNKRRQHTSTAVIPVTLPFDVLILDLNLPDMNGAEVVHSLLSHPHTQALPLIFCTAANPAEILKVMRLTPHASFVGKPFTYQELTAAVSNALDPSKR